MDGETANPKMPDGIDSEGICFPFLGCPGGSGMKPWTSRCQGSAAAGGFMPREVMEARDPARGDARIGFYVCLARHAGRHAIAIEPQSKNLKPLHKNLRANSYDDVEVVQQGVSDKAGTAMLYGPSGTGASVIPGWAHQHTGYHSVISLTTLDTLLEGRFPGKELLIKIDVEGAEYLVLKGAAATLARRPQPLWMMEICLEEYHPQGMNPGYLATFEKFWEHGYEARTADARQRLVEPEEVRAWVKAGHTGSGVINYLFAPAGSNKF